MTPPQAPSRRNQCTRLVAAQIATSAGMAAVAANVSSIAWPSPLRRYSWKSRMLSRMQIANCRLQIRNRYCRNPNLPSAISNSSMDIHNIADVPAFTTKDGSEIRELLAHRNSCIRNQSLAEARLLPGGERRLIFIHSRKRFITCSKEPAGCKSMARFAM